jgi:hypothetical protein
MSLPFSFRTNLSLPQSPRISSQDSSYEDILALYNAIFTLAQQIDIVLTLTEDVRVDNNAGGLILKDTQATPHYWRVKVSTLGVLTTTDLGTSLP